MAEWVVTLGSGELPSADPSQNKSKEEERKEARSAVLRRLTFPALPAALRITYPEVGRLEFKKGLAARKGTCTTANGWI